MMSLSFQRLTAVHLVTRDSALLALAISSLSCGYAGGERSSAEVQSSAAAKPATTAAAARPQPRRVRVLVESDLDRPVVDGLTEDGVKPGPSGTFYLLDYLGKRVWQFDSLGAVKAILGKPGRGPGEIATPTILVGLNDGVGVVDAGKNALVLLGAQRAQPRDLPLDTLLRRSASTITGLGQYADNGWIVSYTERTSTGWQERLVRIAAGRDTILAATAHATVHPVRLSCGIVMFPEPPVFWPTVRWSSRGELLVFTAVAEYEVAVVRQATVGSSLTRQVSPELATMAHARAQPIGRRVRAMDRACDLSAEEAAKQRTVAKHIPLITALAIRPNGEIWVRRAGSAKTAPIDIFDANGVFLDSLLATPFPLAFLSPDCFVAIEYDEDDAARITLWTMDSAARSGVSQ